MGLFSMIKDSFISSGELRRINQEINQHLIKAVRLFENDGGIVTHLNAASIKYEVREIERLMPKFHQQINRLDPSHFSSTIVTNIDGRTMYLPQYLQGVEESLAIMNNALRGFY